MPSQILHDQSVAFKRRVPEIQPGFTVRVHERIREGDKERVQIFEGLVIAVHKGHVATDRSFTVRRISSGVGVEKVFSLHSPVIEKIEVKKVAKVRRSKLYFLRGRLGKSARMIERFTSADEFTVPSEPVVAEAPVAEAVEAPAAEPVAAEPAAAEVSASDETPAA
jgi:large subunit ribosomal protein L19